MSDATDVRLDVSAGEDRAPARPQRDDPFHIALVGDFSGRAGRESDRATGRPVTVDRDDLDDVLAALAPRLALTLDDGTVVDLAFAELDDFHPDRLFDRAPFFRALRESRRRLADPGTFTETLSAILGGAERESGTERTADADDVVADVLSGSVLDRVLGDRPAEDPFRSFLRGIVAPHVVPGEDPQRDALVERLDASIAAGLRQVLHHPRFQALEALWRGVDFLVRRLETGVSLKLFLIDATAEDLRRRPDALDGRLGAGRYAVILVDHAVGAHAEDLALLRDLARVAAARGSALLAGAAPSLVGLEDFATLPDAHEIVAWQNDGWHAFRRSADATFVGLVQPRMLMRAPYGEESDPCERLDFEELSDPPAHGEFLWGSGAFAGALLLGQAFTDAGWRMQPGILLDVPGLPLHTWSTVAGPEIKPCAECLMSDRAADALMGAGPMVLASVKHGDTARLVRFQSLASPPRALQGPWSL